MEDHKCKLIEFGLCYINKTIEEVFEQVSDTISVVSKEDLVGGQVVCELDKWWGEGGE